MIGWMPSAATSQPFHTPSTSERPSASPNAISVVPTPSVLSLIHRQASAPLIATTAPTERSMPRVAITSVMPIAIRISGAPFFRMSTRLP